MGRTEDNVRESDGLGQRLIGRNAAYLRVLHEVRRYSQCEAPVLVEGETGTGKELIARALHYQSTRRGGPFVPVNCAALPEHLVVNELFGHERGAFTGAQATRGGLVDEARGGTIFFDEIDSLPLPAQAVLLRFLQDQEYRPLGGGTLRQGDVRVVAASNTVMLNLVRAKKFREDLYYRLYVLNLVLPPLRARSEDILLLSDHFLAHLQERYGQPVRKLTSGAETALHRHDWPGNVRELENRLHRAFLLAQDAWITEEDLDLPTPGEHAQDQPCPFAEAKAKAVAEFEQAYLCRVMSETKGNVSAASRLAGKERRAFTRLLRKHGIDRQAYVSGT